MKKEEKQEKLKFPIGHFEKPKKITRKIIEEWIDDIEAFPKNLKKEVKKLSYNQLITTYRPDGWTIMQVIHHCADSHMNSFIRFKLALTEDKPIIKPYFEDKWAELEDSTNTPISESLKLLKGLHERWAILLRSLTEDQLKRTFIHPEQGCEFSLEEYLGFYSWHCKHHLAHIVQLKKEKGWK
jgi:hypothetical protein